ncbi:sensor histidine kinase [bacterium]|nr:sensor histidine kinase [bacterium]
MDTYFASAERVSKKQLFSEIATVNKNPVIDGLLQSVGGLLAILNEKRQTLAVNDSFLKMFEIDDPSETLGLRIGEILQCIHAFDKPAGCGTSKFCSTCGTAIATISSFNQNKTSEQKCSLTVEKDGKAIDIALQVRSHPFQIEGQKFLLLFLLDITLQQQRAALERTFFHDINNMLFGLVGASELLSRTYSENDLVRIVRQSSLRLYKAIEIQRALLASESSSYSIVPEEITTGQIHDELYALYLNHPVKKHKHLQISTNSMTYTFKTDISLLQRLLSNMITNALEASDRDGLVKVWIKHSDKTIDFRVHNSQVIPEDIKRRVFQRNFSTKAEEGRGIGTYSMKLFGEQVLGGKVSFNSSRKTGTTFKFLLPL